MVAEKFPGPEWAIKVIGFAFHDKRGDAVRLNRKKLPVARDEGLLVEHVGDETVVYDNESKEAHCLSPLAAVVFAHCDGRTSVEKLATLAAERLGEPVDAPRVEDALVQLEERDLLAVPPALRGGLSRREMISRSAAAAGSAAFAAPLITSIVAPAAVAAKTATCGDLLCCPCCQEEALNKEECCTILNVTVNCECTGNRDVFPGEPASGKFCKPSGVAAPDDAECEAMFPNETERTAFCGPNQVGGGQNCNECTPPA